VIYSATGLLNARNTDKEFYNKINKEQDNLKFREQLSEYDQKKKEENK
jgi:hypothetical protein